MDRFQKKWIRREFNKTNGMIFLYKILFGQLTFLIMMAMYRLLPVGEHFNDGAVWYLISGFLCLGIFVIWRRPSFFRTQIFPVHSHMIPGKFLGFFGIFMIAQNASSVLYVLMEMGAQHFGFTFARSLEAATGGSVTISMLLYSGFAAPLIEEFIFRGAVLKTLEPFGKWFALLASSLAFALMHGNFAQIPFAMAAGLILGYIAMEYSIWYSLLLHISNNLILGDVLPRIAGIMPGNSGNILYNVITNLLVILGIVLLLRKYRSIPGICSSESHNTGKLLFLYFTSIFGILFILSCIWNGFAGISPL